MRNRIRSARTHQETKLDNEERVKRGYEICEQLGRHTSEHQRELYPELHELTIGYLFGEIWSRPHLDLRTREMITLATNIALARPVGNHSHYKSALHLGIPKEEIMELIIQVGHYAGWPTIALAARQFAEVLKEHEEGKSTSAFI
jgi:4-carboxymuconolactone decarboxylase